MDPQRAARRPGCHSAILAALAVAALAVVAMASAFASDATQSSGPAHSLAPVVVTATGSPTDVLLVPAAVDVIDGRDVHRALPAINLSESLQRVPGVVARDRQNLAQDQQISIRGFGARATFGVRGVRLYTDGIPATMPDGQGQVSHFSLDAAERIEILRGPFSALYGNASGGVIQVFSASAPEHPEFETGLVAGSDGLLRGSVSWRGLLDDAGAHGLRFDAGQLHTDGFRRHSAAQRFGAQATLKGRLGKRTDYILLANALDLQADDPQGLKASELAGDRRASSPNALLFDARKTVRQSQGGVKLDHELSASQHLLLTAYAGRRKTFQMLTVPVPAQANPLHGGGVVDLDRSYHGVDARWQWKGRLLAQPFSVTFGLQQEISGERRRGFENFLGAQLGVVGALRRDEDDRVASMDQYVQADWQPTERWRIDAGARHSRVSFHSDDHYVRAGNPDDSGRVAYAETSPVAGLLFRATPWLSLYANAGGGFETPTLSELAYRNDGGSGLNAGLRPARSRNVEAGMRGRRGGSEFSAALFQSLTSDELVVVSNSGGRSVFGNADLSRRRGLELAYSRTLSPHWRMAANYTLLDAAYLRDVVACSTPLCRQQVLLIRAGRRIPGLSRQLAWAELRWSPSDSTDLALEGRAVGRVFADDANHAAAPGYATMDLSVEQRGIIGAMHWRAFARLDNLLDRKVIGSVIVNESNGRYFEPAPGRNWVVGISANWSFD